MATRATAATSLILGLWLFGSHPFHDVLHAQAPAPMPPPPLHQGSAEFAFVNTTGNSSTQTIGLAGEFIYRPSLWETRSKISYVRNEADDQLKAQSFVASFRAQRAIVPHVSGFGQYAYQRDRFAGILHRQTLDAGINYSMFNHPLQTLAFDAAVGYANEDRLVVKSLSTAAVETGGVYVLRVSETSEIDEDGHFAFSLSEGRDWRYANIASVTAKMTTIFSLKLSNTIRYVNAPVEGFRSTDIITSVALVAKF